MKYLKEEAEPELKGYHLKSMGYLALVFLAALFLAGLAWIFGDAVMPVVFPAFFTLPLFMFGIMIWRTTTVHCPKCKRKMKKEKRIQVIEEKAFGRYPCTPWNIFRCYQCEESWRVPAIALGEGGQSISQKEYDKIDQTRAGNG